MKKRKMIIEQVVAPWMIVKKSSNLLKESTSYSRSSTQRVSLLHEAIGELRTKEERIRKRNALVVAKRGTTLKIVLS
jgi:hypothetical protein